MKDYRLSEIKAICEAHWVYDKWCKGCPFDKGQFCEITGQDYQPFLWVIDKNEAKEKLIADLNKAAVRMNWGTVERTINDNGTNGMPYDIDVIARTIAYLEGENEDD